MLLTEGYTHNAYVHLFAYTHVHKHTHTYTNTNNRCVPVAMPSNKANTLIGFLSSAGMGDMNSGGSC